jgi:hypothetical protein
MQVSFFVKRSDIAKECCHHCLAARLITKTQHTHCTGTTTRLHSTTVQRHMVWNAHKIVKKNSRSHENQSEWHIMGVPPASATQRAKQLLNDMTQVTGTWAVGLRQEIASRLVPTRSISGTRPFHSQFSLSPKSMRSSTDFFFNFHQALE